MFKRMKQLRATAAAWTTNNTVLLDGEFGVTTDTRVVKLGNGSTPWNSLPPILATIYNKISDPDNIGLSSDRMRPIQAEQTGNIQTTSATFIEFNTLVRVDNICPPSGRMMVVVSSSIESAVASGNAGGYTSFDVVNLDNNSTAYVADALRSYSYFGLAGTLASGSASYLLEGLVPGTTYQFILKHSCITGTVNFGKRRLAVIPQF